MSDKIEQEVTINAPIETVWKVITSPEHITKWFSDKIEIDMREGAKGKLIWDAFGEAPLEVITLDEPNHFAFAWIAPDEETKSTDQQTLVEFKLTSDANATKLYLAESVFDTQKFSDEQKASLFGKHASGWGSFADKLKQHAESL